MLWEDAKVCFYVCVFWKTNKFHVYIFSIIERLHAYEGFQTLFFLKSSNLRESQPAAISSIGQKYLYKVTGQTEHMQCYHRSFYCQAEQNLYDGILQKYIFTPVLTRLKIFIGFYE